MSMAATARPVDGGLQHEVEVNRRHTIITDEPFELGGTDRGPAPHELLPAILAACVSTMIVTYAKARELDVSKVSVDVEYDQSTTPRRVHVVVNAPAHFTAEQLERLHRIADTCPVKRALEAGFSFEETVLAQPSPQLGLLVAGRPHRDT